MANSRTLSVNIVGNARGLSKAFADAEKASRGAFSGLARGAKIAGVALAGAGAAAGVIGFQFASMKEQAQIAFTTMLGSGRKAKVFLDQLQAFAAKTPFEFPELVQSSQKLMAMGIAAKDVIPTLTAIGDAVAGLGGNAETVDRVTVALGQMNAKGKASSEEMMQLTEAGIPAWRMLADAIGKSIPETMKAVTKGQVDANTAITALRTGMGKQFGGMMAKQSQTAAGLISTLKDNFKIAAGQAVEAFMPLIKVGIGGMSTALQKAQPVIKSVSDWLVNTGVPAMSRGWDTVSSAARKAWPAVQAAMVAVIGWVKSEAIPVIMNLWNGVIRPAFQGIASTARAVWPQVSDALRTVGDAITNDLRPALDNIIGVVKRLLPTFQTVFRAVASVVGPILRTVANAIKTILAVISGDWDRAWSGLKGVVVGVMKNIPSAILQAVRAIAKAAFDLGVRIANAIMLGIGNLAARIQHAIGSAIQNALGGEASAGARKAVAGRGGALGLNQPGYGSKERSRVSVAGLLRPSPGSPSLSAAATASQILTGMGRDDTRQDNAARTSGENAARGRGVTNPERIRLEGEQAVTKRRIAENKKKQAVVLRALKRVKAQIKGTKNSLAAAYKKLRGLADNKKNAAARSKQQSLIDSLKSKLESLYGDERGLIAQAADLISEGKDLGAESASLQAQINDTTPIEDTGGDTAPAADTGGGDNGSSSTGGDTGGGDTGGAGGGGDSGTVTQPAPVFNEVTLNVYPQGAAASDPRALAAALSWQFRGAVPAP